MTLAMRAVHFSLSRAEEAAAVDNGDIDIDGVEIGVEIAADVVSWKIVSKETK